MSIREIIPRDARNGTDPVRRDKGHGRYYKTIKVLLEDGII